MKRYIKRVIKTYRNFYFSFLDVDYWKAVFEGVYCLVFFIISPVMVFVIPFIAIYLNIKDKD